MISQNVAEPPRTVCTHTHTILFAPYSQLRWKMNWTQIQYKKTAKEQKKKRNSIMGPCRLLLSTNKKKKKEKKTHERTKMLSNNIPFVLRILDLCATFLSSLSLLGSFFSITFYVSHIDLRKGTYRNPTQSTLRIFVHSRTHKPTTKQMSYFRFGRAHSWNKINISWYAWHTYVPVCVCAAVCAGVFVVCGDGCPY